MPIVKLQKVTFYGLANDRERVVKELQRLGCLHLIDLPGKGTHKVRERKEQATVNEAIHYLQSSPVFNPNQQKDYGSDRHFNCLAVAREALQNRDRKTALNDEKDLLKKNVELMEPFGEFRLPDLDHIDNLMLWFYQVPRHQMDLFRESSLVWQEINQDRQFVYVVVVSDSEPDLPLNRTSLDRRPLSELKQRLATVEQELETLHWDRVAMTRWLTLLERDRDYADDELAREEAVERMFGDQDLFALQAWAPKSALAELESFAKNFGLAMTVAAPAAGESPPTLLKNPLVVAGAEGAVTFYITPSYQAWDPTWIMYFSFALFFAMIMSDAAYGLIMGVLLAFFWKKLSGTEKLREFRLLLVALVVATVVYGVAIGSFFGVTPAGFDRLQLKVEGQPLTSHQDAMMMLSLAIGVFHLSLANLINAWRFMGSPQALCSLGWALAISGGFMFGLFTAPENKAAIWLGQWIGQPAEVWQPLMRQSGLVSLLAGLGMVFLFSSSRPFFSLKLSDWGWRVLDGLLGLTNVTKAFGDTLSYLRLFALGLASAQLAVTFNQLAAGVQEVQGLGFLLAIMILVIGHGVNILLGIMGGVVHGLRLNCIEFFNWSLTEEGYPFRPFSKKAG